MPKTHLKGINFTGKLQGASVSMFRKSELFSQVFLKDIGLRCRKFIMQIELLKINYFEIPLSCDVLYLLVFFS